jgi:hypothetical protein
VLACVAMGWGAGTRALVTLDTSVETSMCWQVRMQMIASQHVWLVPPTFGRRLAMIGQAPGRRQVGRLVKMGLYSRRWEE